LSQQLAALRHSEQSEVESWRERCDKAQEEMGHLRDKTRVLLEEREEQIERLKLQLRQRGGGALSAPPSLRDMGAALAAGHSPGGGAGLAPVPERGSATHGGAAPGEGGAGGAGAGGAAGARPLGPGPPSPSRLAPGTGKATAEGPPQQLPDLPLSTIRPPGGGLEETPGNSHDGADGMALGALRHRLRMLETQVGAGPSSAPRPASWSCRLHRPHGACAAHRAQLRCDSGPSYDTPHTHPPLASLHNSHARHPPPPQVEHFRRAWEDSERTHALRDQADQASKDEIAALQGASGLVNTDLLYLRSVIMSGFETGELPCDRSMFQVRGGGGGRGGGGQGAQRLCGAESAAAR
jgi:hypothetical protein